MSLSQGSLVRRLARASGLVGVTLVFIANFTNDHFVAALQEDTQNVDALQSDAAQARDASTTGLDQLAAAERISRLEVNLAAVTSRSATDEAQSIIDTFTIYFSTLKSSIDLLNDSLTQVKEFPDRGVTLAADTMQSVEAISAEVAEIERAADANTQELAELKTRFDAADSADDRAAISEQIDEIFGAFETLERDYKELAEDITGLFASIEEQVEAERQASAETSGFVGMLVYVLSAVGAAVAGFGNWLRNRFVASADQDRALTV